MRACRLLEPVPGRIKSGQGEFDRMAILTFKAAHMQQFVQRAITHAGWSAREADIAAQHLILADQSGHPSHGVGMLARYIQAMQEGFLKPANQPATMMRNGSFLVVQGNTALGQVAAHDMTRDAIALASEQGVAVANLVNAHHIGRIGHYAEMAAAAGMIGLFWVNVSGADVVVAPWGGRKARYSTNPHAIGIPRAGGQPFLLDFATSRLAHGKTRVAHLAGKTVPFGAVMDSEGNPTDDPAVMWNEPMGALAPFGEHKGYGMALACELLATMFGGGDTIAESRRRGIIHNSMMAIIIDPARFGPAAADWQARAERYFAWVQSDDGGEPGAVKIPGDPEFAARAAAADRLQYESGNWASVTLAVRALGLPESEIPQGEPLPA